MDVKTTFLNGNLTEEVYMTQPEGFISRSGSKVCKLQRSIYGLKQTSRTWNIQFKVEIKEFDFSQNVDESCVYKMYGGVQSCSQCCMWMTYYLVEMTSHW